MNSLSPASLLQALSWRYATKAFDAGRKIDSSTWAALEDALVLTPSSYGLQPWKFIVVESHALREQLRTASYNQRQVTECSHFLVLAHLPELEESDVDRFLDSFAAARNIPRAALDGYRKIILGDVHGHRRPRMIEWTRHQCYIALGNFMTCAAVLGVDTCPMEGMVPARYDEILGLDATRFRTVVACAAGYRSAEDNTASGKKVRYPKAELIERR